MKHDVEVRKAIAEIEKKNAQYETKEVKAATVEESPETVLGVKVLKLSNGEEVVLRLGSITGNTIIDAKDNLHQLRKKSTGLVIDELDDMYYMIIAEAIGNKKLEHLLDLGYKDYAKVRDAVRDFLALD